jgi:acetoin utilization deacetylase AcuC-like enzyme
MRVVFGSGYYVELPGNHRFPMRKYPALYEILLGEGLIRPRDVISPSEAAWDDLARVHTVDYLNDVAHGTLSPAAIRRLGFPWSPTLVRRSRLSVDGAYLAARIALEDGRGANLAGGTHHGFADRGEGFCVFNDVAVAIRRLQHEDRVRRVAIIDLDVHQGNGTAQIFENDPDVFTFSMHGARNYPFHKTRSHLDVELPDGADDDEYLSTLARHLPDVLRRAQPQLAFYLAGVDIAAGDRFGRLAVSRDGIHARERYVLQTLRTAGVPVAIVLSGGYAATAELTADLHAILHREAAR